MKKFLTLLIILLGIMFLTGCADVVIIDSCTNADSYGFWSGLWHGSIAFFSLIGSLFSDDIAMYGVNNTGGWYDVGFVFHKTGIYNVLPTGTINTVEC